MQFLCSPLLGALSDRYGRRPVILISCLGLGLDYIFMAVAPSLALLLVGRIISGVTAATISTAFAYIADVTPPDGRAKAFGIVGMAFGLGFVLGPAIGGLLGGSIRVCRSGFGRGLPGQRRLRLVRAPRIAAGRAAHGIRLEARQSRGVAQPPALASPVARPGGGRFPGIGRPSGAAVGVRPLCRVSLRLERDHRRPDTGLRRHLHHGRAGPADRPDRRPARGTKLADCGLADRRAGHGDLWPGAQRPVVLARRAGDGAVGPGWGLRSRT